MNKRTLGADGPEVSATRTWLHGDVGVLRIHRRGGGDRDDSPRARARVQLPRHGPAVRADDERGTRRSRDRGPSRRVRDRDEVRASHRRRDARRHVDARSARRFRRARPHLRRGLAETSRKPTASTSTTSTASTRTSRSRRPSARWPNWCSRARSCTSACPRRAPRRSAARTPCTRSPPCRPSTRCGRATSRPRSCRRCRELGIGFVPYSPLGRGFLSGRFTTPEDLDEDDFRRYGPRFTGENLDANLKLAEKVKEIADGEGVTPAQLALAWVLAQGEDLVPIPGTKRRSYLEENAGAARSS